ncbi:MAG: response regulator [Polyangiaceae bacterium]|nr:response regulator [Polyangiaceae bacterium]
MTPRQPGSSSKTPYEILLVDDDQAVLAVHDRRLSRAGFTVTSCHDPRAALALVEAAPPRFALVITDLHMPEMSGADLARRIKATAPTTRVILLSGSGVEPGDGSIDALLEKPVSLEVLVAKVQSLVDT